MELSPELQAKSIQIRNQSWPNCPVKLRTKHEDCVDNIARPYKMWSKKK